jgi:hypothetical protein
VTVREPGIREDLTRRADPAGNERLTAMTGAVLLVLFVAECLTLLNIGNLLTLHVFLGMLLLGPVGLKIGSTLWRFTRYYTGSAAYVRRGPPAPLQRVTGPFVMLTTVAVLGTGIMLVVEGPGNGSWGRRPDDTMDAGCLRWFWPDRVSDPGGRVRRMPCGSM